MRIYRRHKDRPEWHIDFRYKDENGQWKRRIEVVGPNKKLAEQVLRKRMGEVAEGKFFPERKKRRISFSEMADLYMELHGKHQPSGHITNHHVRRLKKHFGAKMLDKITIPDVLRYVNGVKERTSASTANRHHAILRAIFNRGIEWEKFDGPNPAAKVKPFRVENSRLRFLSKEEIGSLLESCSPRIYPLVVCALLTGMRRGEILGLAWENVNLAQDVLYVLKSKSGKPREIPIARKLREVLVALGPKKSGRLFEISDMTLRRDFPVALRAAGIENFRFHDLRHTFASHYVMRTNDLPATQKLLGHHSPVMTQRYAHLSTGHLKVGIELLDTGLDTNWIHLSIKDQGTTEKPKDLQPNAGVVQW